MKYDEVTITVTMQYNTIWPWRKKRVLVALTLPDRFTGMETMTALVETLANKNPGAFADLMTAATRPREGLL
jgi:hypothetical protein